MVPGYLPAIHTDQLTGEKKELHFKESSFGQYLGIFRLGRGDREIGRQ